jgi:DNA-binding PadR family transcriptional regulator
VNRSTASREFSEQGAEATVLLTPAVFHILLALADGPSHGYGIMQDVERFSAGQTHLGPGTLYRSIQRMLVDGLIEELAVSLQSESDDDRRRYYRLTTRGLEVAASEAERLANLVEAARRRKLLSKRRRKGQKG